MDNILNLEKVGIITVSVYKSHLHSNINQTIFDIKTDNDDVLPVSYVIEDVLKLY